MSLGKKLIKLRVGRKLTQQEVADYLNIARQTVSKWENDKTLPPLETLQELCELYQTSISELMDHQQSGTTVKNSYLEIQKSLEKMQYQNKKRQYLSYILMVLCLISLSASIFVNKEFMKYKENLYNNNNYEYEVQKTNPFKHVYEDREMFSSTPENPTYLKVTKIDIGKKEVEISGQFILKKYSTDTNCRLLLDDKHSYLLTKLGKNIFTLNVIIPLENYSGVYLEIDDSQGKKQLERLDLNQDNSYIGIFDLVFNTHDATTTIYIPVENNKLELDTIVYEPNLTLLNDIVFDGEYFQEGTISIRLFNENQQMIFNEEIPLDTRHVFKLDEALEFGKKIYCGYQISVQTNEDWYGMTKGLYESNYTGKDIIIMDQTEPIYLYRYK